MLTNIINKNKKEDNVPRSNIAVDKQLAQRLAGAAEIKNKPIYALTNEIIKIGLDLIDEKVDVNECLIR
ncbi:hypothetical protein [Caldisphaera sp.]|jgi:hypothetical protein|uniref:hypothetical protein n=1 Tax=Caldisphaera sp. TaxID=2060322 RepID=UPI003D133DB6